MFGLLKHTHEWNKQAVAQGKPSLFDQAFIEEQTIGFSDMLAEPDRTEWAEIHRYTGLSPDHLEALAKLYIQSERPIFCREWALPNIDMVQPTFIYLPTWYYAVAY